MKLPEVGINNHTLVSDIARADLTESFNPHGSDPEMAFQIDRQAAILEIKTPEDRTNLIRAVTAIGRLLRSSP